MDVKKVFFEQLSFFISVPALIWQFFFLYFPLAFIVYLSFVSSDSADAGFTLAHYASFLSWPYIAIVARSFGLAFVNATVSLCLAYPVAYFLALHMKRWKHIFLFLMILPFWTSLLVQVYA